MVFAVAIQTRDGARTGLTVKVFVYWLKVSLLWIIRYDSYVMIHKLCMMKWEMCSWWEQLATTRSLVLLIVWKPLERPFTKEEYFVSGMRWKWGIISNSNMDRILGLVSFICFKFFVDHFYMRPIRTSTYMDTIIRWLSIWEF